MNARAHHARTEPHVMTIGTAIHAAARLDSQASIVMVTISELEFILILYLVLQYINPICTFRNDRSCALDLQGSIVMVTI